MRRYLMGNFSLLALTMALALFCAGPMWAADLHHNIIGKRSISTTTVSNNTAQVGQIVDSLGYEALEYVIVVSTVADTDATFTPKIDVCALDNCDDAVEASIYHGTVAGATFGIADNNTVKMLGAPVTKRYSRLTVTPANNTGAATFSTVAILGGPKWGPTQ